MFTERSRRLWAATEARALGHGGIGVVERATGISRPTIQRGLRELEADTVVPQERTRRPGGGRKAATVLDVTLLRDLDALVEPTAPGDPDSPLRWCCKSTRTLAVALRALGHAVSHTVVAALLHQLGYSLQGNVKTREGGQHPDRDAQFRYIAATVTRAQRQGHPAISVDTKKKELVGDFKNNGRTWRRQGEPDRVRVHDFIIRDPEHGKAIPYGVYDLHRDEGWVSLGIDHVVVVDHRLQPSYLTLDAPKALEVVVLRDGVPACGHAGESSGATILGGYGGWAGSRGDDLTQPTFPVPEELP